MRKIIKWMLLPVVVLAVIFGTEVMCQLPLLTGAERGVQQIALESVTVSGGASDEYDDEAYYEDEEFYDEYAEEDEYWDEEAFYEDEFEEEYEDEAEEALPAEPAGPVTEVAAQAGQTISIPVEGYVETLTLTGEADTENAAYTVICTLADGSSWSTESFFWVMGDDNRDSVAIGREVSSIALTFAESGFTVTGVEKDNRFLLNPYRMLFSGLTAAGAYLLLALRKVVGKKAEVGFLIVALCAGLIMSIGMPPATGNTFDDEIHYGRIAALSHGRPGYLTAAESLLTERGFSVLYDEAYHFEADTLQDQQRFLAALDAAGEDASPAVEVPLQLAFSDTGYVIQALGHGLARALGMPLSMQLIMARVFNMLSYVLLTFLGIRALGRFKITLSAIALMPTPMFLACSLTYDTTINALCFLGTALVMNAILDRDTRLTWQRGLGILLSLVLGAMSKVVYIPLLLLALLLPRSKFDGAAARIWYKTLAVVLCILMVMTMMLSVSEGSISLTDSRGDGADSAGQIAYLLHNPVAYLLIFLRTIWTDFEHYFLTGARTFLGYAGAPVSGTVSLASLLLIAFSIFTDNDPLMQQKLNWKLRTAMLIIGMMAVGMTFTTMYVAYTGVGADYISGVQGRYLIPILPLLAMLCSPDGVQNRMNKTAWHTVFSLTNGAILLTVCWQMLSRYYL